ncbi:hypothetical protein [Chitinophaga arvensicola]|uniref:DinB family protein n=1 Tax=Chitinophaga arvensicola TaxID=29529 RepID=A0A1I0SDV6_9BACT|nr:hypothetical protein [Chitinophaga arvensicola]SEW57229.1 hypothetical protein SAMN04488122_6695 [Chitinophaga arvensicola]
MKSEITIQATELIYQLKQVVETLTDEQYSYKIPVLSGASVGQHTRHIIEFYLELEKGYHSGTVSYDARQRDEKIETQREFAIEKLLMIAGAIVKPDKYLVLTAGYSISEQVSIQVLTNYQRELMYNIEHTIHHMALLKIGAEALSIARLPENFGVASSTIKYRKACAQ